jgi:hypothetical protein
MLQRSRKMGRVVDRDDAAEGGRVESRVNVRRKRGGCDGQLQVSSAVGMNTGELQTVRCV